ncbi:glycosyl transferase family 90 [Flammeovirga kamogawensis]|uniref:Lipopolysaccharide A protein n=1 Tax=Flammeovirga kamogawensis TaxID=373891 RepID=A0ABX8GSD0_9BACT|nr:glycosyl transferase family 90 [Flammeovirga kamogawensis]MBB6462953.1 hypothetical protein [Flammeovirga kamogawensis]QWG06480.1 lipopolysaccharide A protein [Flammeovirga kamogawensis]TRX68309.1 lipopolysaccharide biosynthesis protein [Flammeovirga kamogawensis]
MDIKRLLTKVFYFRHNPIKAIYYLIYGLEEFIIPHNLYKRNLPRLLRNLTDNEYIEQRVNYYNKVEKYFELSKNSVSLKDLKLSEHSSSYYFDLTLITDFFKKDKKINFLFGDITHIPSEPTIVKSRPISNQNQNSILLKLNKIRHFNFISDWIRFKNKKNMLVTRGQVFANHENRINLLEKYFGHPLCNIGNTRSDLKPIETPSGNTFLVDKMSIEKQLNYKFIFCWEGNDVATNLKWVMSSNSIAVMPTPKYETWFMEGTLIPDFHYIHVKDDYSDLIEKIEFYSTHIKEANKIISNSHKFVNQFRNLKRELQIQALVLDKFFRESHQSQTLK